MKRCSSVKTIDLGHQENGHACVVKCRYPCFVQGIYTVTTWHYTALHGHVVHVSFPDGDSEEDPNLTFALDEVEELDMSDEDTRPRPSSTHKGPTPRSTPPEPRHTKRGRPAGGVKSGNVVVQLTCGVLSVLTGPIKIQFMIPVAGVVRLFVMSSDFDIFDVRERVGTELMKRSSDLQLLWTSVWGRQSDRFTLCSNEDWDRLVAFVRENCHRKNTRGYQIALQDGFEKPTATKASLSFLVYFLLMIYRP